MVQVFHLHHLFCQIKQICNFSRNDSMGRTGKIVFLRTRIKIRQGIIISAFQYKIASFGTQFYTRSSGNTIIKFIIDRLVMLFGYNIGVSQLIPITGNRVLIAQKETYLRTCMNKNCIPRSFPNAKWAKNGIST